MARLKNGRFCYTHAPELAEQRAAARRKGAARTNSRGPLIDAAPPAPLDLGTLESRSDISRALIELSRMIARSQIEPKRGRLIVDGLKAALGAIDGIGGDFGEAPLGGRELTDDELRWMRAHLGKMPPGVELLGDGRMWVRGEWKPTPDEKVELEEREEEQRAVAAFVEKYRRERRPA